MAEVIGVRFKNMGKVYYFDPNSEKLSADDHVVVETARGVECGEVAMANRDVADDSIVQPLKKVIRKATKDDLRRVAENELKAKMRSRSAKENCGARTRNEACRRGVHV